MNKLVVDLSALVAKHANGLTPQEWMNACQRVMLGYFPESECPNLIDADELLVALRAGVRRYQKHQEVREAGGESSGLDRPPA